MLILFENAEIVVLLQSSTSKNRKTGNTCNLWVRSKGPAKNACGDCPSLPKSQGGNSTGKRSCYAWRGKPGLLLAKLPAVACATLAELRSAVGGRIVRSAVIGDSGMIPAADWQRIQDRLTTAGASKIIGYTHQWGSATHLQATHLASADSLSQAQTAWFAGWRTFRVLDKTVQPWRGRNEFGEVACPAWASNGVVKCTDCKLCDGASTKPSVAIAAH